MSFCQNSVTKEGYVQKEIRYALDIADEKPEETIYLIPVRFVYCQVPTRLARLQWVDLFDQNGYEKLLLALGNRANSVGIQINPSKNQENYRANTVEIPAGEFIMGPAAQGRLFF